MDLDALRKLALDLPHTELSGHMGQEDVRVNGKIFVTFKEDGTAVLKLTPDQQAMFLETSSNKFTPVNGGWGLKGWTVFSYDRVAPPEATHALDTAWRNVAQKRMISAFDEGKKQ